MAGEVWIKDGEISAYSSPDCTLAAVNKATAEGKTVDVVYVIDHAFGIKVFAKLAFYSLNTKDGKHPEIVPFLLKKDAEAYAAKNGGRLATYDEVLKAAKI